MFFAFTSTLVLAMAATITGHPLESRNTQAGNLNQHLSRRNPPVVPIVLVAAVDKKAGAYDEDIEAADPAEVLGRQVEDDIRIFSAYDGDIATANPAEVLGNQGGDAEIQIDLLSHVAKPGGKVLVERATRQGYIN